MSITLAITSCLDTNCTVMPLATHMLVVCTKVKLNEVVNKMHQVNRTTNRFPKIGFIQWQYLLGLHEVSY